MHSIGVHIIGVQSIGVYSVGVHSIGVQCIGVHSIGVHIIGVPSIVVHSIGVQSIGKLNDLQDFFNPKYLCPYPTCRVEWGKSAQWSKATGMTVGRTINHKQSSLVIPSKFGVTLPQPRPKDYRTLPPQSCLPHTLQEDTKLQENT